MMSNNLKGFILVMEGTTDLEGYPVKAGNCPRSGLCAARMYKITNNIYFI